LEYLTDLIIKASRESQEFKKFIDGVLKKLEAYHNQTKESFNEEIDSNLRTADIDDGKVLYEAKFSIVAFASESKRDFIKLLIKKLSREKINFKDLSGEILVEPFDQLSPKPMTLPEVDSSISKISISNQKGFSFASQQLRPGYLLFYSTFSFSEQDETIQRPVVGTAIMLSIIRSSESISNQHKFESSQSDKDIYLNLKREQARLLDKFTNQEIDFETWQKMDQEYNKLVSKAKMKLDQSN